MSEEGHGTMVIMHEGRETMVIMHEGRETIPLCMEVSVDRGIYGCRRQLEYACQSV